MSLFLGKDLHEEESSISTSASSNSSDSTCSPSQKQQQLQSHKRKAGRKKFKETRHPVYRGVRERNGGKWVCEVREPQKKSRIWLGTYPTPEMAARAHDVAAIALRGESAPLNFPDSEWLLPRARTPHAEDIRAAATRAAEMFRPVSGRCARAKDEGRRGRKARSSAAVEVEVSVADHTSTSKVTGEAPAAMETGFVDEEELFNMPVLLQSMAEAMMLSPPSAHDNSFEENCDMDFSLWND